MNYFEDFAFQEVVDTSTLNTSVTEPFVFIDRDDISVPDSSTREKINIGELWKLENELFITESRFIPWAHRSIRSVFNERLDSLGGQIGEQLTMEKRRIRFVTKKDMKPKTEEERIFLLERYGEYILNNVAGDCLRNPDGTFLIRIARAGMGRVYSMDEVLKLMAHEYGHTLGDDIDALFEEVKAFTFCNLFMSHYYGSQFRDPATGHSNLHRRAADYVCQLLESNISEEAVLAHLIGQQFGGAKPDDYKRLT